MIIALVAFYALRQWHGDGSDTIDFRGERFKMRKAYQTHDDYKDDPENLDGNWRLVS